MIGKDRYDKRFIWNPNICECDQSCDTGEYLDYENAKCKKRLVNKLVGECSENMDGNEMIYNVALNDHKKVRNSWKIYILLLVIFRMVSTSISSAFIYFHWYLKKYYY